MDPLTQAAVVLFVLTLMGATLYALRGRGLQTVLSRRPGNAAGRQLESVDRLSLTPQHSLHLVRVEDRTVLVAVSPHGCSILESGHTEHGGLVR